jgi:DNA-directed RNA polymerase sigma subunit (sigma70/sigma32)
MNTENAFRTNEPARSPRGGVSGSTLSPILRRYLQQVGATPLLDANQEVKLASQLTTARLSIATLVRDLPQECRAFVLTGSVSDTKLDATWPLHELDRTLGKLAHYDDEHPDAAVTASLRALRVHKRKLDAARDGLILANLRLP